MDDDLSSKRRSRSLFPRDVGSLFKGIYIPPDAKLQDVVWTTTMHSLLVTFTSAMSAEEFKTEVESRLKNVGWSAAIDDRDETYKTREHKVSVGLRNSDDQLGIFVSDDACNEQSYAGKYPSASK